MTSGSSLSPAARLTLLEPPASRVAMVLDTDTYNEIDDQFALAYALLSPERITVEASYAAPFHNERSSGPDDGMRKSHDEIVRVLDRLGRRAGTPAFQGSTCWLPDAATPVHSAAVDDLVERAMAPRDGPLYVVAIGAPTNVASAILLAPRIVERIVVVWLGGNSTTWPTAREFNLRQDMAASRLLFDSGVPLVHVPCHNVAAHLRTTEAEIDRYVKGRGAIGDYLSSVYSACYDDHFGRSRVLWDLAPVAWLVHPAWVETSLVPRPILTTECTWSRDGRRHLIREAWTVDRDAVYTDLFRKLERAAS
ncbi:MAG: nucleoside hydrolase [Chloroflexota bacterium]